LGADAEGVRVATGRGVLRLLRLQRPGGRMLAAPEFLRGLPLPAGTVLVSRPMAPLVSATPFRR
jgi:methionyl-tRNA formyltransferase